MREGATGRVRKGQIIVRKGQEEGGAGGRERQVGRDRLALERDRREKLEKAGESDISGRRT